MGLSVRLPWSISIARELLMTLTSQSLPAVDTHLGDLSFYPDLTLNAFIDLKLKGRTVCEGGRFRGMGFTVKTISRSNSVS